MAAVPTMTATTGSRTGRSASHSGGSSWSLSGSGSVNPCCCWWHDAQAVELLCESRLS